MKLLNWKAGRNEMDINELAKQLHKHYYEDFIHIYKTDKEAWDNDHRQKYWIKLAHYVNTLIQQQHECSHDNWRIIADTANMEATIYKCQNCGHTHKVTREHSIEERSNALCPKWIL